MKARKLRIVSQADNQHSHFSTSTDQFSLSLVLPTRKFKEKIEESFVFELMFQDSNVSCL